GDAPKQTTDRSGARCLFCPTFIRKPQLREVATDHGVSEIPLALVVEGEQGRVYLPFPDEHIPEVTKPDVDFLNQLLTDDRRWFSPPLYGMPRYADLFTARQVIALSMFCQLVQEVKDRIRKDAITAGIPDDRRGFANGGVGATAYADAVSVNLAAAL